MLLIAPLPRESLIVLAATGAGLALAQTLRLWARGYALRRRLIVQSARAAAGEERAAKLLSRAGYRVLERQANGEWNVRVDGESQRVSLRADFIVQRRGRRYVAEVKTGDDAPSIAAPATRRQLLEYRCAFAVDGVLLVDAEENRVHAVEFGLPAARPSLRSLFFVFVAGLVAGVLLAALLYATACGAKSGGVNSSCTSLPRTAISTRWMSGHESWQAASDIGCETSRSRLRDRWRAPSRALYPPSTSSSSTGSS